MTDKTEAQPEALRLELHQKCADFATSLRSAANVVQLEGKNVPPSFLRAADLFEQAASEIQQLKAEKAEMAALNYENYEFQRKKADAATATVYRFHYAMKDAGWHPGRTDDDLTDIIRAKGRELAQLSARQAAPDGQWKCGDEFLPYHPDASHVDPAYRDGWNDCYRAAPPPPEREPQQDMFPMQPVVLASDGMHRFNENRIVRRLVDHGKSTGYGLNEIARDYAEGLYSVEEQMQIAQLIGYSVYGYGTLSYVTDASYERAAAMSERLAADPPKGATNDNP